MKTYTDIEKTHDLDVVTVLVAVWVTVPPEIVIVELPEAAFVVFKPKCPSTKGGLLDVGLSLVLEILVEVGIEVVVVGGDERRKVADDDVEKLVEANI